MKSSNVQTRPQAKATSGTSSRRTNGEKKVSNGELEKKSAAEIHRCRLFELQETERFSRGKKYFAEVWDTISKPFEEDRLPEGSVLASEEDSSNERLRRSMVKIRRKLHIRDVGFWTGHPMVG